MTTGFAPMATDTAFARRSARYLAANGLAPRRIESVLVEELDVPSEVASHIISDIAA